MTINPIPGAVMPVAPAATDLPLQELVKSSGHLGLLLAQLQSGTADLIQVLTVWEELGKQLDHVKAWEMDFRKALFDHCFPAPKTGVNNFPLASGYVLKGTPKVNINIDDAMIPVVRAKLAAQHVNVDAFLKYKPSLNTSVYNALVKEEESSELKPIGSALREMMTTTPGAPVLEIVLPKRAAKV